MSDQKPEETGERVVDAEHIDAIGDRVFNARHLVQHIMTSIKKGCSVIQFNRRSMLTMLEGIDEKLEKIDQYIADKVPSKFRSWPTLLGPQRKGACLEMAAKAEPVFDNDTGELKHIAIKLKKDDRTVNMQLVVKRNREKEKEELPRPGTLLISAESEDGTHSWAAIGEVVAAGWIGLNDTMEWLREFHVTGE